MLVALSGGWEGMPDGLADECGADLFYAVAIGQKAWLGGLPSGICRPTCA